MKSILRCALIILLSIQFLLTVHSAPVELFKRSSNVDEKGVRRRLTKSQNKVEKAEKKSDLKKKTTVSINGQLLPLASVSTSGKNIHVTVQKANDIDQHSLPPSIQEVTNGGQVSGPTGMSPGYQPPGAQITGSQSQTGFHPGIQTSSTQGLGGVPQGILNPGTQTLGMSPGISNPGTQVLGMSPGVSNPGTQVLGMSPGLTGSQITGQQVGMHPGIQNLQNQGIGQTNCGTNNLVPGQNLINPQGEQNQAVFSKNSEGQLTYRPLPLAC